MFEQILLNITTSRIVYCKSTCKIPAIARHFIWYWTDTVLIKDKDEVIGIITDGIVFDIISKADPKIYEYTAKDIMDKNIITVNVDKAFNFIEVVKDKIEKTPVKRLLIEKDGEIIGLIKKKRFERVKRYARTFNVEFK